EVDAENTGSEVDGKVNEDTDGDGIGRTTLPAGTVYSTSRNYIPTSRNYLLQNS
ncbi:hypothetical protein Tco_0827770, partial [Tanacetum coccineum]